MSHPANDKITDHILDGMGKGVSDCCSANVYAPTKDWAKCLECHEFCEEIDKEDSPEWATPSTLKL